MPPRPYKPGKIGQIKSGDPDVRQFDKIIVHFSGGKDSVAALLYMIEIVRACGRDPSRVIECWHASVDGSPFAKGRRHVFDWPITEEYCISLCNHLKIPLLFLWREQGIASGMFAKKGQTNTPICFEDPGPRGPRPTRPVNASRPPYGKPECLDPVRPKEFHRLRWPKARTITLGRFCSAYVKKEPSEASFKAQDYRFNGQRVLMVTGERREESTNRAGYTEREWDFGSGHGKVPGDRSAAGDVLYPEPRYVELWKPVLDWCEIEVWAAIAKYCLTPHPAYLLGFGRLSCCMCIFSSRSQLETIRSTSPEGAQFFRRFVRMEKDLKAAQARTKAKDWRPMLRAKKCCPKEGAAGVNACLKKAQTAAARQAAEEGYGKTEVARIGRVARAKAAAKHAVGTQKATVAHTMKTKEMVKAELVALAKKHGLSTKGLVDEVRRRVGDQGIGTSKPLPLATFTDTELQPHKQIDPMDAPGGPQAARHRARAEEGLAVAYTAAAENPWLAKMAMKTKLPGWWTPTTDYWRMSEDYVEDGVEKAGAWLPAGAFGEDAGPT
jgi:3'-phosphoadenosine 5'-phosphosulfate sulfotransferase (PAPS reductase)/FAD synthetase